MSRRLASGASQNGGRLCTTSATSPRSPRREDIDWPRPDPDPIYRRFGPDDWTRFIADLTDGAISYIAAPQPCPFCPDGTARATLTLKPAKGMRPPKYQCSRCQRSGDILGLIALVADEFLEPNVDVLDTLAKWAGDNDLPEVYRPEPKERPITRADLLNTRRLLQASEDLRGLIDDLFTEEVILERPIPRPDYGLAKDWHRRPFQDDDATHLAEVLLARKLLKATSGLVHEVIRGIAKDVSSTQCAITCARSTWDGTNRLSNGSSTSPAQLPSIPTIPSARTARLTLKRSRAPR